MAEGRSRQLWQHTSHVLWMVRACAPFGKKGQKIPTPNQLNPHYSGRPRGRGLSREKFADLVIAQGRRNGRRPPLHGAT